MSQNFQTWRAFLKGTAGMTLALPVLEAMGKDVAEKTPRRFCALYTANGMSLPHAKHGIDEWSWFPRAEQDGEFVFGKSTEAFAPFRQQLSFMGGLYHPNGPKSDPHVCSDMWLTGAPLQDPKREVYNSVALDQVVAKHTKQFCRQPSLVMSVDAGVGVPVAHRYHFLQLHGQADPGREQSAPDFQPPLPRRPRVHGGSAQEPQAPH